MKDQTRTWRNDAGVRLVWNKGIASLCDRRIPDEFPPGACYAHVPTLAGQSIERDGPDRLLADPSVCDELDDGALIWVRVSWLPSFVRQVLPRLNSRFVLVTGDSDACVPSELGKVAGEILGSPLLLHWFAQNYDASAAAQHMSPIPIGIDFHSLSERPRWGEAQCPPAAQEGQLRAIAGEAASRQRRPKVLVDFEVQRSQGWRRLAGARVRGDPFGALARLRDAGGIEISARMARRRLWRRKAEYVFALSPHGSGLDCHRTWESLALGQIVLAPTSSLDPMFAGLPVVTFSDWSELTMDNLAAWHESLVPCSCAHEKLSSRYWVDRMRELSARHAAGPGSVD